MTPFQETLFLSTYALCAGATGALAFVNGMVYGEYTVRLIVGSIVSAALWPLVWVYALWGAWMWGE